MERNINGLSIDAETMAIMGSMARDEFILWGKGRCYYSEQSESTQTKWLNELHKIAVESTSKKEEKKK